MRYWQGRKRTYFNPRPREEGDYRLYPQEEQQGYFNPRPREEGDEVLASAFNMNKVISIHALVKRATRYMT